jgi:hypothetical protein
LIRSSPRSSSTSTPQLNSPADGRLSAVWPLVRWVSRCDKWAANLAIEVSVRDCRATAASAMTSVPSACVRTRARTSARRRGLECPPSRSSAHASARAGWRSVGSFADATATLISRLRGASHRASGQSAVGRPGASPARPRPPWPPRSRLGALGRAYCRPRRPTTRPKLRLVQRSQVTLFSCERGLIPARSDGR